MKNLLSLIAFTAIVISQSCAPETFESKTRKIAEAYIKNNIDNVDGFEFVSIEKADTVTFNDFRKDEIMLLDIRNEGNAKRIKDIMYLDSLSRLILKYGPNYNAESQIKEGKESIIEIKARQAKRDSFASELNNTDSVTVKEYRMEYKFRAKNESGNLELNKYYVRFDPDWKLISASKIEH